MKFSGWLLQKEICTESKISNTTETYTIAQKLQTRLWPKIIQTSKFMVSPDTPYVLHHLATTGCPLITPLMWSLCLSAGGHMAHLTCNHEFHVFNVFCQNSNVLLNIYMCIRSNWYAAFITSLNPCTML